MTKLEQWEWGDYFISAVQMNGDKIGHALVYKSGDGSFSKYEVVKRMEIIIDIANGFNYATILRTENNTWQRGTAVRLVKMGADWFIRVDKSEKAVDDLGDVAKILSTDEIIDHTRVEITGAESSEKKSILGKMYTIDTINVIHIDKLKRIAQAMMNNECPPNSEHDTCTGPMTNRCASCWGTWLNEQCDREEK